MDLNSAIKKQMLEKISCPNDRLGLMLGEVGTTLFFAAKRNSDLNFLEHSINKIVENAQGLENYSLSNGFTGLAFLLEYLKKKTYIDNDSLYVLQEVNELVLKGLKGYSEQNEYDYLHGWLGIVNYLCYARHEVILTSEFQKTFDHFLHQVLTLNLPPLTENLGLAHGIPSVLSVTINLALATEDSFFMNRINNLVLLLKSFRNNKSKLAKYPSKINSDFDNSRLAWCYGDLGINCALLKAANYLKNKNLLNDTLADLKHCSGRRNLKDVYIIDNSLCHGTSGCVYFFKQLYKKYNIQDFNDAAFFWQNQIFTTIKENGTSGLKYFLHSEGWVYEKGLLEGLAGIYLALFPEEFEVSVFNFLFLTESFQEWN